MSRTLKRELLFWVIAAAVMGGYVALGNLLAPEVPPEPDGGFGVVRLKSSGDLFRELKRINEQREAISEAKLRRHEFLRDWYRWGAAVAIGLIVIHTWLRPPWRAAADETETSRPQPARDHSRQLPMSRWALFSIAMTLLLLIAGLVALATLFP